MLHFQTTITHNKKSSLCEAINETRFYILLQQSHFTGLKNKLVTRPKILIRFYFRRGFLGLGKWLTVHTIFAVTYVIFFI